MYNHLVSFIHYLHFCIECGKGSKSAKVCKMNVPYVLQNCSIAMLVLSTFEQQAQNKNVDQGVSVTVAY